MKYYELLQIMLKEFTPAQMGDDVTICTPDHEYYPVELRVYHGYGDLDDGCPYLKAKE